MKIKKGKGFLAEFKEFISRGSVIDLAVGVIVGSAFTAIVNSLVKDIITPVFGWIFSGTDLSKYKYIITPAADGVEESAILYGAFLEGIINFLLIAFVVFIMVKAINAFRKKKEEASPPPPVADKQVELLAEIRDLLKNTNA